MTISFALALTMIKSVIILVGVILIFVVKHHRLNLLLPKFIGSILIIIYLFSSHFFIVKTDKIVSSNKNLEMSFGLITVGFFIKNEFNRKSNKVGVFFFNFSLNLITISI